jgi:hypothetical protein
MKIIQFKKAEIENNPYQKQRAKLTYRKESKKKKKTYRNTDGFDGLLLSLNEIWGNLFFN